MIRATTGGVMLNYRRNLMNSFIGMSNAHNTVLTQRTFNSYAEDPASAAKAFKLRKARMSVETQYTICGDTFHKYQAAFSSLQTIDKEIDTENGGESLNTLKGTTLKMLNDPTGDAREQLTKVLDQISEALVQNMNQKYGENFIFAGADGHNVPFEIKDNQLYYRGVSVDAAEPKLLPDNDNPLQLENGSYVLADASTIRVRDFQMNGGNLVTVTTEKGNTLNVIDGATPITQADYDQLSSTDQLDYVKVTDDAGAEVYYKMEDLGSKADYDTAVANSAMKKQNGDYYIVNINGQDHYIVDNPDNVISAGDYNAAKAEADKLKYLADEKYFVDIGLGFQENENGQLIESSGFNASLVGINFFGYGLDEDGDPKNIYSIVQKLKDIGARVHDGEDWTEADYEEFRGLVSKLETASSNFKTEFTDMAAGTDKLENNLELLEDNYDNLVEQYGDMEDADMVESITSFIWAQYCYNAALKVGNSVLSQSLMDYLS